MVTGKTKTGFEYSIDERIVKDYRYVRALAKLNKGDSAEKFIAFDQISTLMLSDKVDDLISHVEKLNDGFAPIEVIGAEVTEMIGALTPKNSISSQES